MSEGNVIEKENNKDMMNKTGYANKNRKPLRPIYKSNYNENYFYNGQNNNWKNKGYKKNSGFNKSEINYGYKDYNDFEEKESNYRLKNNYNKEKA